jgi:signal transduction histidine kinase
MTNSKLAQSGGRSERLWLPSLLLLAQFLTITPVLIIVFADEEQRTLSNEYLTLLDGLDRLSFEVAKLDEIPRRDETQHVAGPADAAWQQQYSQYRGELNRILSGSAPTPEIRESLARADSAVKRMAKTESDLAGLDKRREQAEPLARELRKDGLTAGSELSNARLRMRTQLSTTGNTLAHRMTYVKVFAAGACLLAFGLVLVVRRFRVDAAIQSRLQQELRATNEEVIAALDATRSESEAKNQFLAHIGHWMQTPLKAIAGGMEELLQTDPTCAQRESIQTGQESAESLSKVAGQMIDFSRLESGSLAMQSIEFEPARLVTEVLEIFSPSTERKGLRLKSAIGEGLSTVLKGDPERLRQVLVNLMSNAVRFTEQGEISIRVEEVIGAEGRTSLRFEIKDTGIGITEQARNHLFQPFSQQADPATARNGGAGLGLAISKKLVELMGGKIDVVSEPGRGCAFRFTAAFESILAPMKPHPQGSQAISSAADTAAAAQCETKQTGKRAGRERRTEPRHGINYPTLLRSEEAGIGIIRVLDVSTSGLRVSVPFRLTVQSEVEIRIEGASVVGIVRNCSCIRANEFHVGIEIPRASASSEQFLHHLRLLRME